MKYKFFYYCIFILSLPFRLLIANEDEINCLTEYCAEILNVPIENLCCKRFNAGVGNHVYLISTQSNKKIVAKIFTKKSLEEVKDIENNILELKHFGINIPNTISISLFQNKYPLHLSEYVNGSHVTDKDLSQVAQLMAQVHQCGYNFSQYPKEKFKKDSHYQQLFKKCESWDLVKELKDIYDHLDLSYLSSIPLGVIHGDFSYSNIIKTLDNNLTLIDFDHICTSYLLTDIVRCHMFYGFDEKGELLENKVLDFTQHYNSVRPLTQDEKKKFYTHMKLMMIDTALEMYYHIYIIKDLPIEVVKDEANKMLVPDLLVKKIINLKAKNAIDLNNSKKQFNTPIIFFGLSGVGKTTIIKTLINKYPDLFYIPIFTTTRNPRPDDESSEFEYISIDEFLKLDKENAFFLKMNEGSRYYGYRYSNLSEKNRYPLLNCSPCGINEAKSLNAILVLIQGDWKKGLTNRNQQDIINERTKINDKLIREYYSKSWFLDSMNIIIWNEWNQVETTINALYKEIMKKIGNFNNEYIFEKAS